MSKKKIYNKRLLKGKFYVHSDRQGGHPAYLYKKNDKKNQYFILIFTSSPGLYRRKLKFSIESDKIKTSYIQNMPSVVKRRELGAKELNRIKISKADKPLIIVIQRKK